MPTQKVREDINKKVNKTVGKRLNKWKIPYRNISTRMWDGPYSSTTTEIISGESHVHVDLVNLPPIKMMVEFVGRRARVPSKFQVEEGVLAGPYRTFYFDEDGFNKLKLELKVPKKPKVLTAPDPTVTHKKRVPVSKARTGNYITRLRKTAQELDTSVKSKDINNQEDFIYVCMANNWDSFSCLGYLRRAGVKRLSKKSKQLLRNEDSWSEFDDEIYYDPEVYPEGPE